MRALAAALAVLAVSSPARGQEADRYGTDGFLGRVSRGTEEVDRCQPPDDVSDEERRARASDHYDRGLVLYEQGDYARAIEEFVVSYCDKPHPSAFYNIGQSYERLLDYEKAVAYFERYILESDPDDPNRKRAALRVEVFKRHPARITVATAPPGASVTLIGDTGVNAQGVANGAEPLLVPKGRYTMKIEHPGYQTETEELVARIGQPYSYYYRLEPEKGILRVTASPESARIFLEQRLVGVGSYVETVPVGSYELVVEAEGRPPEKQTIEVVQGNTTERRITLEERPESGRRSLIIASSVGLGVAGAAALGSLLDEDPSLAGIAGLAGLGLGFGGAYVGVPDEVTRPQAWTIISAGLVGSIEGAVVGAFFGCESDVNALGDEVETCRDEAVSGGMLIGTMGGTLAGALAATRFDYSGGDVALIDSAAFWGLTTGSLVLAVFDTDKRIREPMLFAGLNVGLVTGVTLAARTEVSTRRVALIDLSGLAGVITGFAVAQAADSDNEQQDHITLLGMGAGLITGTFLTRGMDEPDTSPGTVAPSVSTATDSAGDTTTLWGLRLGF